MKDAIKVFVLMAGLVLGFGAQAFTIEDDFESGTLNPIWNVAFNGGQPAQVDFVSQVRVKSTNEPTFDGGKAVRIRGEEVKTVSFGTSWICGNEGCDLSFVTRFNALDTDPFVDFGEVVVKSSTETLVPFHDDVLNTEIPTWHSFVMHLAPGQWDFTVVHENGFDVTVSSEMFLDNFRVTGAVSAVPIPGSAIFGLSGFGVLTLVRRRKI